MNNEKRRPFLLRGKKCFTLFLVVNVDKGKIMYIFFFKKKNVFKINKTHRIELKTEAPTIFNS